MNTETNYPRCRSNATPCHSPHLAAEKKLPRGAVFKWFWRIGSVAKHMALLAMLRICQKPLKCNIESRRKRGLWKK